MRDVAKFYGLQMNHSGMARCPFHDDRTPSLKVYDDHFYCFGCGATGDCTGFTAKLFGIPQIEAAKKGLLRLVERKERRSNGSFGGGET